MKKIISFLIPILIAVATTVSINKFLDKKIMTLVEEKNPSQIGSNYGDLVKDRGVLIKDILSNNGSLFLMGSSEMGVDVPQNTIKFFPFKGAEYNVSCFGRAYTQDLQQATLLGSCDLEKNQKVALIVSLQWFEDAEGMQPQNFAVNFSDIQFYKFLNNSDISDENKDYYARRIYGFLTGAKEYPAEAFYARLYYSKSILKKPIMLMLEPYYKIKEYLLNIKDKALLYKELKALPDKGENSELQEVKWQEEYDNIEKENSKLTSTNQFYLKDEYYNTHLKNVIDKVKGNSQNEDLIRSKEVDDYNFLLNVSKESNIEPYIILMPVNGWYYDYLGLTKDKRNVYYDKIKTMANQKGFEVLDLREYEYKQNFLMDVMHLGNEGWLKVSEEIYKHFNE